MKTLTKILSSYFGLLISTAVIAGNVPVILSGKIVHANGQPIAGVRMVNASASASSQPSIVMSIPQIGPQPLRFSPVFPDVPSACLSTESSFPVVTDSRGEYKVRLTFKPDSTVRGRNFEGKSCSEYRSILTIRGTAIAPHSDDVARYKLEFARGPLPKPPPQIKNPGAIQQNQQNRAPGGFVPRHLQ